MLCQSSLALSQQCCLASSEILKCFIPCSQQSGAQSNGPVNAIRRCLFCSVHNSDNSTHAAGLCTEPAASLPDKCQLCQAGRGAQGKPSLHLDPLLRPDAQYTLPCTQLRMALLHPAYAGVQSTLSLLRPMPDAACISLGVALGHACAPPL